MTPEQPPPLHTYAVGALSQLALMVVDWSIAGAAGFAVGAQVGALPPPPDVTQFSVWFGGVPDKVKLLQAVLV